MGKFLLCPACSEEREYEVRLEKEVYPVRGEPTEIEAQVTYCKHCGEQIWNEELDDNNLRKAYRIYKTNHDLLQPEEIKRIREKYGLSQTAFARLLGFGDKTVTRYENGSIQDLAQNNLMMLAEYPNVFKVILMKNQGNITPSEFDRASGELSKFEAKLICNKEFTYQTKNSAYDYQPMKTYFGGLADAR